ncbi:MAG: hypothetical protein ACK4XJ_01055 [Fimbriimonadaceae bacterium]
MEEHTAPDSTPSFRRFVLFWGAVIVGIATLPNLYGFFVTPEGALYLGSQHNLDDHMVYAAWIRQSMDGAFLFDNRFTNQEQPGLTVHLYYWVLGWFARVLGIPLTVLFAKIVFGVAAVVAVGRLIERFSADERIRRMAFVFALLGSGIGGFVFQNFGVAIPEGEGGPLRPVLLGRLPVDVWQPEVFVFPSLLVNGLFAVSLALMAVTLIAVLDARESWRPVLPGFVAFGLLMNIHSYDVLLIAMVLVAFLAMAAATGKATGAWVARAMVIGCGAIPAALWFLYVLQQDAVFQARAATETYSPNFRLLAAGLLLCVVPIWVYAGLSLSHYPPRRRVGVIGLVFLTFAAFFVLAPRHTEGYWLTLGQWGVVYAAVIVLLALSATGRPAFDLILAWAAVGLIAPYFPGLFQRKLSMMLAIPWGILGAWAMVNLLQDRVANWKAATAAAAVILFAIGPNLRWLLREFALIQGDVSNTTMHAVFVEPDVAKALDYLNRQKPSGREVIVAMPGVGAKNTETGEPLRPVVPDYNAMLAGMTGRYALAGHWSETPNYLDRRNEATRIFLPQTPEAEARAWLRENNVRYVLAPRPESVAPAGLMLRDLSRWGAVVVDGGRFQLIRLDP